MPGSDQTGPLVTLFDQIAVQIEQVEAFAAIIDNGTDDYTAYCDALLDYEIASGEVAEHMATLLSDASVARSIRVGLKLIDDARAAPAEA